MKKYALIISILVLPFMSYGFPAFPMAFWGNVTINGASAPVGTVIRAYYGTTLVGQVVVQESGIYGYTESTKQKLVTGEGSGIITFKIQSVAFNNGNETEGTSIQTLPQFTSGEVINKNLEFIIPVPVVPPPSSGGGGGGSGSIASGGGGGSVSAGLILGVTTKNGDASGDGKIDVFDFNLLMINWGNNPKNKKADLNSDDKVDIFDFNFLMINWGK